MTILMHEPTDELFLGVIHPDAALFSDYFNIDLAAREHAGYRNELRKIGAEVLTVREILLKDTIDEQGNPINGPALDKLREFASEFLIYNTDAIPDDREEQEEYRRSILMRANPKDLVRIILLQPEVVLSYTEANTGFAATYIQRPIMNIFFMRDQMISTEKGIIIGRMHTPQRETECRIAEFCLEKIGMPPIGKINREGGYLEGGDFLQFSHSAFIGCGLRTTQTAIDQILEEDLLGYERLYVVKDNWLEQEQMHLDTYFNVIDLDLVSISEERLNAGPESSQHLQLDVYERKAGGNYEKIVSGADFVDYLRNTLNVKIIPVSREDELRFANNYLTVGRRKIMAVAGQSQALQDDLRDNGVEVTWVPLSNLIKGYGAAHCMTQVLGKDEIF